MPDFRLVEPWSAILRSHSHFSQMSCDSGDWVLRWLKANHWTIGSEHSCTVWSRKAAHSDHSLGSNLDYWILYVWSTFGGPATYFKLTRNLDWTVNNCESHQGYQTEILKIVTEVSKELRQCHQLMIPRRSFNLTKWWLMMIFDD